MSPRFSKKTFDDVLEDQQYVVSNSVPTVLEYKLRNGKIEIDLIDNINQVLKDAGFDEYKVENFNIAIPFTVDEQVTSNAINVIINKQRYKLNLKNPEVLPSKRQKVDFDNTRPHRWSINQWLKFYEDLFYDTFGATCIEFHIGKNGRARGKFSGDMNSIRSKMSALDENISDKDISNYFRWVMDCKSEKINHFSFKVLIWSTLIDEWYRKIWKKKEVKTHGKKKRKWD
jgi:hypothetical protein